MLFPFFAFRSERYGAIFMATRDQAVSPARSRTQGTTQPDTETMARRVLRRPEQVVAAAAFLLEMGMAVAFALRVQVGSYTPIPWWDLWDEMRPAIAARAGKLTLTDLWTQHNEHRTLVSRLQFIADYSFFNGRLVFCFAMVFVSLVLLALALTWPAASVWNDWAVALGFFALALTAALSPAAIEILTSPLGLSFAQVYLFAVASITLAVCWLRAERDRSGRPHVLAIASIVALGGAATYSLANGLDVWPILVAVMILRRVGARSVWAVVVAGAGFIASYLWHYKPVAGHSSYVTSLEHPLGMARYIVAFLGHPADGLGSHAGTALGILGVLLLLVIVVQCVRYRASLDRATLFGAAAATFVFVTAVQTALGRLGFGVAQALVSRYVIAAAVFWVSLAVGIAPIVARHVVVSVRARSERVNVTGLAFTATCVALCFATSLASSPTAQVLYSLRTRSEPMVVAFVAGVQDDQASAASHPGSVVPQLTWLRVNRLGPWSSGAIGDALEGAQRRVGRLRTLPSCSGSVDSVTAVQGGQRLDGWVVPPAGRNASRELDVVNGSGLPVGVGLVDVYRPDVKSAGASSSNYSGFVAYGRSSGLARDLVLLQPTSHEPICALPIPPS
jgi:hypothetical protein